MVNMRWWKPVLFAALLVLGLWFFRYDVQIAGSRIAMLDRWTGNVYAEGGGRLVKLERLSDVPYAEASPPAFDYNSFRTK